MNLIKKGDLPKNFYFPYKFAVSDNKDELLRDVSGLRAPTRFRFFIVRDFLLFVMKRHHSIPITEC